MLESASSKSEESVSIIPTFPVPKDKEMSTIREVGFLFCTFMSQFMTFASLTQTMGPFEHFAENFKVSGNSGEIAWFAASFSITSGTFVIPFTRLGEIWGHKKLHILGFIWFSTACLVCGFSGFTHSRIFFDISRALQGIGPAMTISCSNSLLALYYPDGMKKNIILAIFSGIAPCGIAIGLIFDGILSNYANSIAVPAVFLTFFIQAIACFIIAVLGYFTIPDGIGTSSFGEKFFDQFDYQGFLSLIIALNMINFSWTQGPNVGWDHVYVYIILIIGIFSLLAFIFIQYKVKNPLIPVKTISKNTIFTLGCISCTWSSFGIWLYFTNQWAILIDGTNLIVLGAQFIPMGIAALLTTILPLILDSRRKNLIFMMLSMTCFVVGAVLMGTRPVGQIYWAQKFVSIIIFPVGMGTSLLIANCILGSEFKEERQPVAGSLVATFQIYFIAFGLGVAGTAVKYRTQNMVESFSTLVFQMRIAFYVSIGFASLGFFLSVIFIIVSYLSSEFFR